MFVINSSHLPGYYWLQAATQALHFRPSLSAVAGVGSQGRALLPGLIVLWMLPHLDALRPGERGGWAFISFSCH